jgi:hypothetical protein
MARRRLDRPTYQRSGRVAWLRFLPLAIVTLLVAGGMAYVWFLAHDAGWGYWIITPAILALPVVWAAYVAVAVGRCRNRGVAGTLGVLASLVFYLGFFHAGLVDRDGADALTRLDRLPEYIAERMADGAGPFGRQWLPPGEFYSCFYAFVELLVVTMFIAGLAVYRSLFAYCESCGRWMRSIALRAPSGSAYDVADALEDGNWSDVPEIEGTGMFQARAAFLEFEYCPNAREPGRSCPAYLTLREYHGGTEGQDQLMYQGRITADELTGLADRVEALSWLRVSAPTATEELSPTRPVERHAGSVAAVERLPGDAGGQDLERASKVEMILAIGTLATALVGVGLTIWGAVRAPWSNPDGDWLGYTLVVVGPVMALVGGVMTWVNVDYLGMQYAIRRLRARLVQRPDALVPADDPDAWFVEVIPRVQWHQLNPDKATDRGLLRIDRTSRRLVFEGLKERYVIPADAILACDVVPMLPHTGNWNIYAVVLACRYPMDAPASVTGGRRDEEWEVPLVPRPTQFRRYGNAYRRDLAEELREEIEELFPDLGNEPV